MEEALITVLSVSVRVSVVDFQVTTVGMWVGVAVSRVGEMDSPYTKVSQYSGR